MDNGEMNNYWWTIKRSNSHRWVVTRMDPPQLGGILKDKYITLRQTGEVKMLHVGTSSTVINN